MPGRVRVRHPQRCRVGDVQRQLNFAIGGRTEAGDRPAGPVDRRHRIPAEPGAQFLDQLPRSLADRVLVTGRPEQELGERAGGRLDRGDRGTGIVGVELGLIVGRDRVAPVAEHDGSGCAPAVPGDEDRHIGLGPAQPFPVDRERLARSGEFQSARCALGSERHPDELDDLIDEPIGVLAERGEIGVAEPVGDVRVEVVGERRAIVRVRRGESEVGRSDAGRGHPIPDREVRGPGEADASADTITPGPSVRRR